MINHKTLVMVMKKEHCNPKKKKEEELLIVFHDMIEDVEANEKNES